MLLNDVACIQSAMIWKWPSHKVVAIVVADSKHVQANIMYLGNIIAENARWYLHRLYICSLQGSASGLQMKLIHSISLCLGDITLQFLVIVCVGAE